MEYCKITNRVIRSFYESDREYPSSLLRPILGYDSENNVVDKFLVCRVKQNRDSGIIESVEGPFEIYQQRIDNDENGEFVKPVIESDEGFAPISYEPGTSIMEFTSLYVQVREFAFEKNLSDAQKKALRRLVTIYELFFNREIRILYHRYGARFFEWACEVVKE